ncbi:MAG: AmmeMemoRadiSam system protein A, partial [Thermoanaerobaculia bacterium]|nr:AmmeMemoRadiSam system protein A [Thermoanaerobaculia bacterium]
ALGCAPPGPAPAEPSGRLAEPGMCFVTWKRDGILRGCIGSVEPVRPLWVDVEANAVHALLRDPRFPAATPDEFPLFRADISVLSPFARVSDPLSAVEIGVHGLLVEMGRRRGLFLPQVAVDWGWDLPTFLGQACLKAGLPEDVWREDGSLASISTFTAEVFSETGG